MKLLVAAIVLLRFPGSLHSQPAPGMLARFDRDANAEVLILPNAAFYLPANARPSRATLEGFVSVDLRAQHSFQVESGGPGELSINGNSVLSFDGGGKSELSKPVRLNKGANSLRLTLSFKDSQPAQARLFWKSRNLALPIPISPAALSHDPANPLLREREQLRRGARAWNERQCGHCHGDGNPQPKTAPSLAGIGGRVKLDWLASWIADPSKHRADARMPSLSDPAQAQAIAAFLAQTDRPSPPERGGNADAGARLFETLHCASCHTTEARDLEKIPLAHVGQKYYRASLRDFLLDPQRHHPGSRMPNFRLTAPEALDLAAFLAPAPDKPGSPPDHTAIEPGRREMAARGCQTCHDGASTASSTLRASPLAQLKNLESGCLGPASPRAPRYTFAEGERDSLRLAIQQRKTELTESPLEFALRETEALRCAACHNSSDGVIRLELIGGKLRPEWSAKMIAGDLPYKTRPWLAARMPRFNVNGFKLASGLAALHGIPPYAQLESIGHSLAATGAKLVSAAGGFSCVACHAVGSSGSGVVVESPGVNLAYSGERLLKSFFERWVMNPVALDPATKMPVYFDEAGRSQLLDFFEGDGPKQIEAMWHYIQLGDKMPPPPAP